MSCPFCGHANPAGSAFCESCGARQAPICPACGAESRTSARFCRGCGNPLEPSLLDRPAENAAMLIAPNGSLPAEHLNGRAATLASGDAMAPGAGDRPTGTARLMGLGHSKPAGAGPPLWNVDQPSRSRIADQNREARPPFVGRQRESCALTKAVERTRSGAGAVIEVVGEAGIGKTRLVDELRAAMPKDDPWWFETSAEDRDRSMPLRLAVDLLLALLGPSVAAPGAPILASALRQVLPKEDCPALAEALAGYLRPAGPGEAMGPGLRRRLIVHALRRVIESLARRRPIGLVLDNLQFADPSSLDVLGALLPRLASVPVLVIAIFRPEFTPPWSGEVAPTRFALGGLSLDEALPLVESLAEGPVDADTAGFLNERTGGNPLFLKTLMRMLLRESYLEAGTGVQRLPFRRYALLPPSLDELYRLQIERLGENIRLALTPAVLIGESFSLRQLSELVRTERTWTVPDTLLTGNLEHLLQCDLIEPQGDSGTYRFQHDLIRAVARDLAPPLRASRLHTLLARLIEQESSPWTGQRLQRLAYHFGQGDRAAKAIEYHSRAGEHALSVEAFAEAEVHYLAGMERLAEAGAGQERSVLVESLTAGLARTRAGLEQFEAAEAGFRAALAASDDPLQRASVLDGLAGVLAKQWRHQDALFELGQEGDALRGFSGEPSLLASLRLQLRRIELLRELGWYADAEEAAMEALIAAGAYDPRFDARISPLLQEAVAQLCATLGEIKILRRDLQSAEDVLARARGIAESLRDSRCLAGVTEQLAHLAWLRGDLETAADTYRSARDLQLQSGDFRAAALSTHNLALVFWRQSRVSDAEVNLLDALRGLELAGELDAFRAALNNLERIYWYRGDFARLEALYAKEQSLAQEAGWNIERDSLLFRGRIAFERGDLANAEGQLRAVLSAAESPVDELSLEALLLLGSTLVALGDLTEAEKTLENGARLAQERRDPVTLAQAYLGLAELHYRRCDDSASGEWATAAASLVGTPEQRLRLGARHLLGRYYRLAALIAVRARHWDEAEAAFRQSLELLESMEAYLEAARTRLAWAETLLAGCQSPLASETAARAPRIRTLLADALATFHSAGLALEKEQVQATLTRL